MRSGDGAVAFGTGGAWECIARRTCDEKSKPCEVLATGITAKNSSETDTLCAVVCTKGACRDGIVLQQS
jgi:hypothetical protein